jgi:hypothetical protein
MFLQRLFKGKTKNQTVPGVAVAAPDVAGRAVAAGRQGGNVDDLGQWAERRVRRMSSIFAAQGYAGARAGRIIRGARHVVVPMRPSAADINRDARIDEKWLQLARNVGKATGTKSYAEWDDTGVIYYFLELPADHWRSWRLDDLDAGDVGQTEYRKPIRFEFNEAYPHALVAGASGSGKSVSIEAIIFALTRAYTPSQLGIIVIDPHNSFGTRQKGDKSERIGSFDNLAHLVMPIAKTPAEIEAAWRWSYDEMAKRLQRQQRDGHVGDVKRIVIVADELAAESVLGRKGKNHEANLLVAKTLGAEARKLRMNLVLGAQKPSEIDVDLFDHLTYRFAGRVTNNGLGTRILGRAGFDLTALSGAGDFIVSARDVRRFQFALPNKADFDALPRADIAIPARHSTPAGLGRIPIQTPPAPVIEADNDPLALLAGDFDAQNAGGAPVKCLDPEKIAYYLHYAVRSDGISIADAEQIAVLQLSRAMHDKHKDAAQVIFDTLKRLKAADVPLSELERIIK